MRKIISLALLAVTLPAAAEAQESATITVKGQNFVYQKTDLSPRTYKLEGQTTDGRYFRLAVKGRHVSGEFGGTPLDFTMSATDHAAATTVLASLR
jgi:hypothetical protein